MKTFLLIFILIISPLSIAVDKDTIRTSFYRQNVAPQLFLDAFGRPTSGILFDLTHAITKNASLKLEMVPIPRKRVEQALNRDIIDMHCTANPKWYNAKNYQWSDAIYNNPDILVNRFNYTSLSDIPQNKGLKVGTSLGYIYPELTALIADKHIKPIVSSTPLESYQKYRKGRTQAFVSASVEASYFSRYPEDSVIVLNDNTIHCMYSAHLSGNLVKRMNDAIEELKSQGVIENILAKYKHEPQSSVEGINIGLPAD